MSSITISRLKSGVSSVTPCGRTGAARVTRTTRGASVDGADSAPNDLAPFGISLTNVSDGIDSAASGDDSWTDIYAGEKVSMGIYDGDDDSIGMYAGDDASFGVFAGVDAPFGMYCAVVFIGGGYKPLAESTFVSNGLRYCTKLAYRCAVP